MSRIFIGVDVCKDFLDAHARPAGLKRRFDNTPAGIEQLVAWVRTLAPQRVVFESTGPYQKAAVGALLADKAFDNDWLRAELNRRGAIAVIPPKADRKDPIHCDFEMYKWRHLIENFFCKLKEFRRIATRSKRATRRPTQAMAR